jgi:hypothetical protein
MSAEPPTFLEHLDYAVLSDTERVELIVLFQLNPLAAHIKLGAIRLGQGVAMQMARDGDEE